ncbi:MAG TPA: MetQ/NlpA family ABC transporter substrate-binding protein [Arthrobacter sp.]|nr:MetQ/NlpA family ABC transporter substrate-binding protein [Arthrobacter sp.]
MPLTKKIATAAAVIAMALSASGCGAASGSDDDVVRIGVVSSGEPYWDTYTKAAAEAGIDVEIVGFSDYAQPNPALSAGELDLNQFQHIVYLAQYNVASGSNLTPVGSTAIYPLGLYSTKYESVEQIPEGATVAVPNDESNQARGLLVLQSAGLVTLKDGGGIFSNVNDVVESKSKVKVISLNAAVTATSLPDVAAAIINNDFIADAGLDAEDALAQDDPSDPNALPYVNIFAAAEGEEDNKTYQKLVDIYHNTPAVVKGVKKASGGTAEILDVPVKDLKKSLAEVEADIEAHDG